MEAVIDTNVIVFDAFVDSEFHSEATTKLDSIDRWYLPSVIIHELVWFFKARKIQLSRARLKVEEFLTNEKTVFSQCTADDIRFAIVQIKNYQEYNDLVILSVAKRLGLQLFTFNDGLKQKAIQNSVKLVK